MSGWVRWGGKRAFDIFLAGFGLLLFSLPMVWIAWRIRRESGYPSLFRQIRIGRNGAEFKIIKFRTMSEKGQVSPFCAKLRSTAMDELPQLFHILKGEMSFVGPRPLIPEELRELKKVPGGERRLKVRPGLTGLAQINSPKIPSLQERLQWDLAYIDQCSWWLDLQTLFKSLIVTAHGKWEGHSLKMPETF